MLNRLIPLIGLSIVVLVNGSFPGIYQRPILSSHQRYKSPTHTQEGWSPDPDSHPRGTHDVSTNYDSSDSAHSPSDIHSSDTSHHDSAHSNDSAHSHIDHRRIRRAPNDPFETMVDRMEKISRVTNGIALQQGLTSHSIPIDTLISELLNLDSVSPDDINKINAEELQTLVTEMEELPNLLKNGFKEAERIEKRFLMYALMLEETEGIGNDVKIEGKDDYLNDVKALKAKNIVFEDWSYLKRFLEIFEMVETQNVSNDIFDNMQSMSSTLKNIKGVNLSDFTTFVDYKKLKHPDQIFKPNFGIQKAIAAFLNDRAVSEYRSVKDQPPTETIKEYLTAIDSIAGNSKKNLAAFRVLDQILLKSRQRVRLSRKLSETPGFSNGFNDLDLVFSDLKDDWVKEVVEGQSDALVKVLDSIRSLIKITGEVSDSSRFASGVQTIISNVFEHATSLSEFSGFFVDFVAHASDIVLETLANDMEAKNTKFDEFFSKIKTLSDILNALDDVFKIYETLASEEYLGKINKTLEITEFTAKTDSTKRRDQLKKSQEAKDIRELIKTANPSIAILKNAANIDQLLADIETGFPEIDEFTTGLSKFFEKMKELRGRKGVKLLKPAISTIQMLRNFQPNFGAFKEVTDRIPEIQKKMKDLKAFVSGFKPSESKENTELMKLPNVQKHSFILGSSTRVFKSMKLASDRKLNLDKTDIDFVLNENASLSWNLDSEDDKNLNNLDGLDAKLTDFYRDVDRIKSSAKVSNSTNLTSLNFTLAESINGLSLDFGAIGRSVEKMSKTSSKKSELLEFKTKLDSLDSMGLDYDSHQSDIGKSADSLSKMELFFANFSSAMAPPAQNLTAPHNSSLAHPVVVKEQNGLSIYLGAALAGAVVVGLTGAGFFLALRYFKNKRAHFDLPFSFGFRFLAIIRFKLTALHYRMLGMQYSDSFLYARYCMELYEHDSKENEEENAGTVTPEFDYDKNTGRLNETNRIVLKLKKLFNLDHYHGNMIEFRDGFLVALCKTPRANHGGGMDTRGPYWLAVAEKRALCVCIGKISGENPHVQPYFPRKVEAEETYNGGKVKVKCMSVEQICSGTMDMLTLRVKIKGMRAFTTQMIVFEDCPDDKFPTLKSFNGLVELIDIVHASKTPVFIACPTGTGYSAVLALALYNRQEIMEKHGKVTMGSLLNEVRNFRINAIESARQYLLALLLIIKDVIASISKHQEVPNEEIIKMSKDIDELFASSERLDANYKNSINDEQKMKQGLLRIESIEVTKKVPKAPKPSEAPKVPKASEAPKVPKASEAQQAPIAPNASKTQETQDIQKTQETQDTQETQQAPAATAPTVNANEIATGPEANEPAANSPPALTAEMVLKTENLCAPTRDPSTLAKDRVGESEARKKLRDAAEAARRATDDRYPHGMGFGFFKKKRPIPKGLEMERTQDGETMPKKKKNKKKKKAVAEEGMTICDDGMTMCDDEEMKEVKVEIPIAPASAPTEPKQV